MNCRICVGVEIFAWEGVKELFQALVTNRFLAFNELKRKVQNKKSWKKWFLLPDHLCVELP